MQSLVGIFRTEGDLQKALGELEKLKPRLDRMRADGSRMFNPGWHLTRDLRSMVLIAEAVTRSALARRESRGAHSRIDYPNFDEAWGMQNNIIANQNGQMILKQRPVPEMPATSNFVENHARRNQGRRHNGPSHSARVRRPERAANRWTTKSPSPGMVVSTRLPHPKYQSPDLASLELQGSAARVPLKLTAVPASLAKPVSIRCRSINRSPSRR